MPQAWPFAQPAEVNEPVMVRVAWPVSPSTSSFSAVLSIAAFAAIPAQASRRSRFQDPYMRINLRVMNAWQSSDADGKRGRCYLFRARRQI
ncbi:hypothetical protein ABIA35_006217 [Catenulispora sp. MAP12-49]|uniref:hypothetical protein n=1 Tax=Catenulispora sp. MAP12-49 TaxID=3156302 RepID=UPI0035197750